MFSRYFLISAMLLQASCVYISEPDVGTSASGPYIDDGWHDEQGGTMPDQNDATPDFDNSSNDTDDDAVAANAEEDSRNEANCSEQKEDESEGGDEISESEESDDHEMESPDCGDETHPAGRCRRQR